MFDSWDSRIVRLRDEPVCVETHKMWPYLAADSFASKHVRDRGARIEAYHSGQLVAWVRQTTGAWLAVVEVVVNSADGAASVPVTLWTPAPTVRVDNTDLSNRRRTHG